MTDATNDEARVAEIRGRCDAATEGPWKERGEYDGDYEVIAPSRWGETPVLDRSDMGDPYGLKADAEFIAHARTDVPRLLAAVEAVLGVHRSRHWRDASVNGWSVDYSTVCATCKTKYPCPTVNAAWDALGVTP